MSISITSGKILQSLYNNNNGSTSFYTGISSRHRVQENEEVMTSISLNADMRKALKGLKNVDYEVGLRSDIKKYAKALVEGYNEFIENTGDGTKRYSARLSEMKNTFKEYSGDLAEIGITLDGKKLKFDSNDFDKADFEDLEKVFSKDSDFVESVDKSLKAMNKMVKNDTHEVISEDIYVANYVDSGLIAAAGSVNSLVNFVNGMNHAELADDGSNKDEIDVMLQDYETKMNSLYDNYDSYLRQSNAEYTKKAEDDYAEIKSLYQNYLQEKSKTDTFDYNMWFSDDENSYGSKVNALYKDLFSEIVGAAKRDFEITSFVDYQV